MEIMHQIVGESISRDNVEVNILIIRVVHDHSTGLVA